MDEELLTVADLARHWNCSRDYVYRRLNPSHRQFIPHRRLPCGDVRFDRREIIGYLKSADKPARVPSKVEAWSTYDPSYISGGMTYYFTPTKFLVYNGQVYARASDGNLYQYGGSNANTYDATLATATIPFMDAKRPTEIKKAMSLDADVTGTWTLSASSDWINKVYQKVAIVTQATFDQGFLAWSSQGTHLSVQATTVAAVQAQIAEVVMGFEPGNEPVE